MLKSKRKNIGLILVTIFVSICLIIYFNYNKEGRFKSKKIVAQMITNNVEQSPVAFEGNIYFPSSYTFSEDNNTEPLGQVEPSKMSFFVYLIMDHRLVCDKSDRFNTHIKTKGDDIRSYSKVDFLENTKLVKDAMDRFSNFLLYDSADTKIKSVIDKELVTKLENQFGEVKYNIDDFKKADKISYIYVDTMKREEVTYIGTILSYKNKLYYGNLSNLIEEELQKKILKESNM